MSGKLLIVLFAVFLVSVHAFVKRDTATTESNTNYLDDIQKQLQQLGKSVSETFNAETVQKGVNDVINNFNKYLNDMKEKTAAPPAKS